MNVLSKYLLSTALSSIPRAPDEPAADAPAADPTASTDPPAPDPAPAADAPDPATPPAAAAETPPAPAPAQQPARAETPKWALDRIGEETSRRQAAERELAEAQRRAADLEEITRRLQAGQQPPANGQTPPATQPNPAGLDQNAVNAAAARMLFEQRAVAIDATGTQTYGPQWAEAVNALRAYGVDPLALAGEIMEIDGAETHKILFDLAQDGAKAFALSKMSPQKRIADITRTVIMSQQPAPAPKSALISQAPAPRPAMAPQAPAPAVDATTPDGDAKMSDAQWNEWFQRDGHKKLFKQSA